eukprot:TRINITY_DN2711_c1_g1_i1.p1 TRINITY_DN2711_c1_g1~~TRINITY_DN2711_c1_g1_i1.p1  ORF type:complete len:632 (+),score=96.54 TRINITY_DN2711_c1_g1_i1:86-1981(+)
MSDGKAWSSKDVFLKLKKGYDENLSLPSTPLLSPRSSQPKSARGRIEGNSSKHLTINKRAKNEVTEKISNLKNNPLALHELHKKIKAIRAKRALPKDGVNHIERNVSSLKKYYKDNYVIELQKKIGLRKTHEEAVIRQHKKIRSERVKQVLDKATYSRSHRIRLNEFRQNKLMEQSKRWTSMVLKILEADKKRRRVTLHEKVTEARHQRKKAVATIQRFVKASLWRRKGKDKSPPVRRQSQASIFFNRVRTLVGVTMSIQARSQANPQRRNANILVSFLRQNQKKTVLKSYTKGALKCQSLMKAYGVCTRARAKIMGLAWQKYEKEILASTVQWLERKARAKSDQAQKEFEATLHELVRMRTLHKTADARRDSAADLKQHFSVAKFEIPTLKKTPASIRNTANRKLLAAVRLNYKLSEIKQHKRDSLNRAQNDVQLTINDTRLLMSLPKEQADKLLVERFFQFNGKFVCPPMLLLTLCKTHMKECIRDELIKVNSHSEDIKDALFSVVGTSRVQLPGISSANPSAFGNETNKHNVANNSNIHSSTASSHQNFVTSGAIRHGSGNDDTKHLNKRRSSINGRRSSLSNITNRIFNKEEPRKKNRPPPKTNTRTIKPPQRPSARGTTSPRKRKV